MNHPYPDWRASFDEKTWREVERLNRRESRVCTCILWTVAGLGVLATVKLILWLEG